MKPIKPKTVILCALSAITLPLTTIRSQVDTCAFFCASCAARSLATFCAGVSAEPKGLPEGPKEDGGCCLLRGKACVCGYEDGEKVFEAADRRVAGLEKAWGEVAVKRVASTADRDILQDSDERYAAIVARVVQRDASTCYRKYRERSNDEHGPP